VALKHDISHERFWEMTPLQLHRVVEAKRSPEHIEMQRQAWLAANLLAPYTEEGQSVGPRDLLYPARGKGKTGDLPELTTEESNRIEREYDSRVISVMHMMHRYWKALEKEDDPEKRRQYHKAIEELKQKRMKLLEQDNGD
jgi:hypothetical protein